MDCFCKPWSDNFCLHMSGGEAATSEKIMDINADIEMMDVQVECVWL